MLLSIEVFGQNTRPIEFMGIPVDGTAEEMREKLVDKGFLYSYSSDAFIGEFNGREVVLMLATYKGKVWKVYVIYSDSDNAYSIIQRYNNLCGQLVNNSKYVCYGNDYIETNLSNWGLTEKIKNEEARFLACPIWNENDYLFVQIANSKSNESFGIVLHYVNRNNEPNGEDL